MLVDLSINPQEETARVTDFISQTLKRAGFSKVIIGLSGGIDSATSLALAVSALGKANIHVCLFPYGGLNPQGLADAQSLVHSFSLTKDNIHLINIQEAVDKIVATDLQVNGTRRGNIMARVRMIYLFNLAKKFNCLVLGTENKTENLLGYFTRFGDSASDIEPISHLYKTQVKELAKYLKLPDDILNKVPTAGLWEGQTDEGEFGFSYEDADQILHLFVDRKKSKEEVLKLGISGEAVEKVIKRLENNQYKHNLPYHL